ncbi:MAG: pyruvate/2-oxoglutarate dehydrogenase complex dihydrolipoamide dehydrogenase (E3) component [Candidatus Promineifilaceae bacterium]|jgi:pyruvate/2-oxoglutarate dehydrogenase complex dihydrolipoamide dehydrogenase (E3) component
MSIEILPADNHFNQKLLANVRPADWVNPVPDGKYNLVVIGAGSAGLVAASGGSSLGAKVAVIEKSFMGGDCLNYGCVPSKGIIRAAKAAASVHSAHHFGVQVPDGVTIDFDAAMGHVRKVRADLAPHDSAKRYHEMGVDVYFGDAQFTGPNTIEVGGVTLEFSKALISTGSHPAHIPIPGLAETGYLTNESIFNLTEQPESLAVIGAGPIGSELAQSFQRLGTQVILIDMASHILPREDADAAEIVQKQLLDDGVQLLTSVRTRSVALGANGKKVITYEKDGVEDSVEVSDILLAVGRRPNVEGLALEQAGVEFTKQGVTVNDLLQTTNSDIYAAGDVASKYQFTHVAGHSGAIVVQNALFPFPKRKFSDMIIPWVTFTEPEVAHVGMYETEAAEAGIEIDTYNVQMKTNDRAVAERETAGFIKVHTVKGSGTILGATIVGSHAGEIINEITIAMKHKLSLGALASVIHPYPTEAEIINKAAIEYNKTRLTPRIKGIMNWWMKRTR